MIKCEICGKEKYFAQWRIKRTKYLFCSMICSHKGMSKFYNGKNGANWQGGKIQTECGYCFKKIAKSKSQLKDLNFCNKKCMNAFNTIKLKDNPLHIGYKNPEHAQKMRDNNPMHDGKTRKRSSITHKKLFADGYIHPLKGKTHLLSSRIKMSLARKELFKNGYISPAIGKLATLSSRIKMSLSRGGDGTLLKKKYPVVFSVRLKEEIRQRDNYKCQNCIITNGEHQKIYEQSLHVHHIDYNKNNCSKENLISLCTVCHNKSNYNRDYWFKYYTSKIKEI